MIEIIWKINWSRLQVFIRKLLLVKSLLSLERIRLSILIRNDESFEDNFNIFFIMKK